MTKAARQYQTRGAPFKVTDLGGRFTMRLQFGDKKSGARTLTLRAPNKEIFAKWWDALAARQAQSVRRGVEGRWDAALHATA